MNPAALKIAYIGGGSRDWARKLMIDLALCPELAGCMALYDIDSEAARVNEQLGNWMQNQPGVVSHWQYTAVDTLQEALRGADFVILSIQPGPLEMMAEEIAVTEEYGMFFPVGDTTGPPGMMRGLRAATIYAGFAEAIDTVCPHAWVINYTNPMTICTRTLTRVEPALKVFGCCHEVHATQRMLAGLIGVYWNVDPAPERAEIRVNVLGLNHFTWIDRAEYQGRNILDLVRRHIAEPGTLRSYTRDEVEGWNDYFHSSDRVKFTLFQQFDLLPAAGDRHLVEFLPGFTRSPETLFHWGVIRTPVAWRIKRRDQAPQKARDLMAGRIPLDLKPSGEDGVKQIRALAGLGDVITNVNLPNRGQIDNLPPEAVVETNAQFSGDRVRPLAAGAIPPGLAPWVARHSACQELIVEAALNRRPDLAFQAVYGDPVSQLTPDAAREMFHRLLAIGREFLPVWKIDGPAA